MKLHFRTVALVLPLLILSNTSCRVRQTEEGEMPDVDVSAEGGKVPEYDVDAADVDVKTEKREVIVPDVDVRYGDEKAVPPGVGPPPTPTPADPPLDPGQN